MLASNRFQAHMIEKKDKARVQAEIILKMTKEAKQIERRVGAKACVVICFFEDDTQVNGKQITVQDAGRFPMPPEEFYELMSSAHQSGQLGPPKSKILKPH